MNYETTNHVLWNEGTSDQIYCENCNEQLNDFEMEDPIVINNHTYCDKCASEVIGLRFQMRDCADITNDLVLASQPVPFQPNITIDPRI